MHVILYQPQIPQNTGNIVRTCSVVGVSLILVKPLGFSISNRLLKRAGLDYWNKLQIECIEDLEHFILNTDASFYFFSSKAKRLYTDVSYSNDCYLIFGSETKGLPPLFYERWPDSFVRIPMQKSARCLNLSNAVAISIYEAWRQNNFV